MIKESPHINSSFDLSLTKEKSKGENKKNNFIYLEIGWFFQNKYTKNVCLVIFSRWKESNQKLLQVSHLKYNQHGVHVISHTWTHL